MLSRRLNSVLLVVYFATPMILIAMAARFPAIPMGTVADYWAVACGTEPTEPPERLRYSSQVGLYPAMDGWLYYFAQEHHGRPVFKVKLSAAASDLPKLGDPPPHIACNSLGSQKETWCKESQSRRRICSALVEAAQAVSSDDLVVDLHHRLTDELTQTERSSFLDQLARSKRKGAAIAFEAAFIVSWQFFLCWPWIRGAAVRRKAINVFVAPVVLFVPFYMGYAPLTFTFGPSGGFVYPLYLLLASIPLELIPCTTIDQFLLRLFPPFLHNLSQLPGPPAAITFYSCVGPLATLVLGGFAAAFYLVASKIRLRRRTHGRKHNDCDG